MTTRVKERTGKEIRAMDTLVRCVNDERLIDAWLMLGIADGDCDTMTDMELYEYYYEDNEESFKEIIELFQRIMKDSMKDGLIIGEVVA